MRRETMDIRGVYPRYVNDVGLRMMILRVVAITITAMAVSPVPAAQDRAGAVRLEGRAFADDGGPWNPLGATLFWALWGERRDTERLDRNLAYLARHGVDYVRILGMVGSPTWRDRAVDPGAGDYWDVVDRLFSRLARHGLRAQVTVFADAQDVMPEAAAREAFALAWAARAEQHRTRVMAIEIANEHWQNGFEGASGVRQLRAIGARVAAATTVPVALSSTAHTPDAWCRLYAGVAGVDAATVHFDRDGRGPEGLWAPVRQPWGYPDRFHTGCEGQLPPTAINNEPIGPFSSVMADDDPLRLALSYATTFIAGGASYVYHAGPGIRGGGEADLARGRPSDFGGIDTPVLEAIRATARRLPQGLANWTRHNAQWPSMPWDGSQHAVDRGDLVRAYAATSGDRFVAVLLGVRRPHAIAARRAMTLALVHPVTGQVEARATLTAGAKWTVPAELPGYLVVGSYTAAP